MPGPALIRLPRLWIRDFRLSQSIQNLASYVRVKASWDEDWIPVGTMDEYMAPDS